MKKMCKDCMEVVVLKKKKKDPKKKEKARGKFDKVMHEYKEDKLHSGSKRGPKVKKLSQALAIAYSEKRKSKKK